MTNAILVSSILSNAQEVVDIISGIATSATGREDFVKKTIDVVKDKHPGYNCLMVKDTHPYQQKFVNIVAMYKVKYPGAIFGLNSASFDVFVFDKGTFDLNGDGGYINWAFHGERSRDWGHVSWD